MILVAIGWLYVVLMMAVAEATSNQGSVLGAVFTFVLYGVLPLGIVLYVMNEPARRRRRRAERLASVTSAAPDRGDHAPGEPVAPERKEP
jgi:predicted membrane channel-forming protein YqfA (hemolysin III family)